MHDPQQPRTSQFQRVQYRQGMILSATDFQQEQQYFLDQQRLHNVTQHGIGTLWGLRVWSEGAYLFVSSGLAQDAEGRLIHVDAVQMLDLNDWLQAPANRDEVYGLAPDQGSLHLHLCYREVAGRAAAGAATDSRIAEQFDLVLTAESPPRDAAPHPLHHILSRLRVSATRHGITPDKMEELVRSLREEHPHHRERSPLWVRPELLEAVLAVALRTWVCEVSPHDRQTAAQEERRQAGVPLARIDFRRRVQGSVSDIRVVDEHRPLLLPVQLLQNLLLTRWASDGDASAGGTGYTVVAVGQVEASGEATGMHLQAERLGLDTYLLRFPGFHPMEPYIVKGTPIVGPGEGSSTFEVVNDPEGSYPGIVVRVRSESLVPPSGGFFVEICRLLGSVRA